MRHIIIFFANTVAKHNSACVTANRFEFRYRPFIIIIPYSRNKHVNSTFTPYPAVIVVKSINPENE